jgi:hypothetical protein
MSCAGHSPSARPSAAAHASSRRRCRSPPVGRPPAVRHETAERTARSAPSVARSSKNTHQSLLRRKRRITSQSKPIGPEPSGPGAVLLIFAARPGRADTFTIDVAMSRHPAALRDFHAYRATNSAVEGGTLSTSLVRSADEMHVRCEGSTCGTAEASRQRCVASPLGAV